MSDGHPMQDLLPGFALGILDEEDTIALKAHLDGCASCRTELVSFREVTGRLAAAAPHRDVPAGLEKRIMAGVEARRRFVPVRRNPWPALTAIAAMLAVGLGVGNLLQWTGVLQPSVRGTQTRLTTALLSGTSDARDAYGTIVLDPADNKGVLAVTGLHGLDKQHQYQLWLIRNGERRSGGVFSPDSEGYGSMLLSVPADFKDFRAFGVTIEPWGGSAAPTGIRVLSGTL
jgi:anti-sigma-K factor RskA